MHPAAVAASRSSPSRVAIVSVLYFEIENKAEERSFQED
jgi:hypothetical protein